MQASVDSSASLALTFKARLAGAASTAVKLTVNHVAFSVDRKAASEARRAENGRQAAGRQFKAKGKKGESPREEIKIAEGGPGETLAI